MPMIKAGPFDVDYTEAGSGPTALLLHSSAAGNRQWRKLMEERAGRNRLVAMNLFGYGKTSSWPGERPMTLNDPANLVVALAHFLPERFTPVGHSLGAATVFGVAYNSCCLDERIDVTITVAGGNLPFEGGTYDGAPPTPMLLVHGELDQTVPIAAGDAMFEFVDGPVWYLRPTSADHITVFTGDPGRLFNDAALTFLDVHLRGGDPTALDALGDEIAAGGIADWQVKP